MRRWGGDATTRYNWKADTYNSGSDYFFTNFAYSNTHPENLPNGSAFDLFVDDNLRTGAKTLGTIPLIGWVAKSRDLTCSYSVAKYGPQQKTEPYHPDCGNGIKPDGKTQITNNDPHDANIPVDETFMQGWLAHVIGRYGKASAGGVQIWSLDNEPEWWMGVHIDVHPKPNTYDEAAQLGIRYASAIKAADPSALVTGPVVSGWMSYFYSAADFVAGWSSHSPWRYDTNPVDRKAHGNVPFVEWYLQQMRNAEQQTGTRLLDYVDVHAYIAPSNISFGSAGGAAHPETDTLRLTSTRAFWDPNYQFQDTTITAPPRLIPRMLEWVAQDYPGTKTAITEYNWGALDDITGAIAQADLLGIFGREGLDLATLWGPPTPTQPGAFAFRAFLNYDGLGGRFGDTAVSAASDDPDRLSLFAAQRSDQAVTILVLNKTTSDLASAVALAASTPATAAQVFTYSPANLKAIVRGPDAAVNSGSIAATFPAHSITVFVVPAALAGPKPVVQAISNAASWQGGPVSPGEIVVLNGVNLGPQQLQTGAAASVLFDGVSAPVIYASQTQVAAVVPYQAALNAQAHVQVEYLGVRSDPFPIAVASAAPGIFTVLNADNSANATANPAGRGDIVVLYATGEGLTDPPGVNGRPAADVLPKPVQTCAVNIGGSSAQVLYCGAAPGFLAGLIQINARIPADAPVGSAPVTLSIGAVSSLPLNLAIR